LPTKNDDLSKINQNLYNFSCLSKEEIIQCSKIINSLIKNKILENLFNANLNIWKSNKITADRFGWINFQKHIPKILDEGSNLLNELFKEEFKQVVLIGIGGSSQSAKIFNSFKNKNNKSLELHVLDSIHEKNVKILFEKLDLRKTIFIISSKSGSTLETNYLFNYFQKKLFENKINNIGNHFVAITDKNSPLHQIALKQQFRYIFSSPKDIGGRFSFTTHFGLIPGLICGFDVEKNLKILKKRSKVFKNNSESNPVLILAVLLYIYHQKGINQLIVTYNTKIKYFATWLEQLIAESNGKELKGLIPILKSENQQKNLISNNKKYAVLDYQLDPKNEDYFIKQNVPYFKSEIISEKNILSEMFKWQLVITILCYLIKIDPFNEPDVNESKILTLDVLKERKKIPKRSKETTEITITKLLDQLNENTPLAINVYLPEFYSLNKKLEELSNLITQKTSCLTFIGYGPRYLHSTGQIQKGGSKNIKTLFIVENKIINKMNSKEEKQLNNLFYVQPEIDILSLKKLGRRASVIDINTDYENELDKIIKIVKNFEYNVKT
tara:strand:+ start:2142 stop:3806 length:1665 start_codon:yes stop_codon:yes gene_type:complete